MTRRKSNHEKLLMIWQRNFTRRTDMKNSIFVLFIVFGLTSLAQGDQVVIDFEQFVSGGYYGSSWYPEDGYILTTESEFRYTIESNSIALYNQGGLISLFKFDGGTFDLVSMEFFPYVEHPGGITFNGVKGNGDPITQFFPYYEGSSTTVYFDNFNNITEVNWAPVGKYSAFDNITIIPEPCTIGLLGLGVLFLRKR